jgi:hypothetical protein
MNMNQQINSDMFADLLNVKHQPGTLLQRLKHDIKGHNNLNMHDRQIILINNPFQNEEEEEEEPSSMPLSSPLSMPLSPLPMIYKEQEPLPCKENELILIHLKQQQELIRQQQELITQQQEQLNAYKKENIVTNNHLPHKKHKKTVRFQLIPFHTKLSKKKTRRATPLPRRSSSLSQKFLKL